MTTDAREPTSSPTDDLYRVEANADKALFVSMLVRDIELLPAIIDLVDNSVDGARATSPGKFEQHTIKLVANSLEFTIEDDCGGIQLDVARKYAFRFGRPADYDGVPGSVGQFGVGMKRALFKLGGAFEVESKTTSSYFNLNVDVNLWMEDQSPDWQFRMAKVEVDRELKDGEVAGTRITAKSLHSSVATDFEDTRILSQLREQIRLRHQGPLEQGLTIILNGEELTGYAPKLLSGAGFRPVNKRFTIAAESGEVHCRIVAGVVASAISDDTLDDGQAEDFSTPGDAGWWLFCNDRLLLIRDRTSLTGWGDSTAAYHPQYRRFRGYVYLTSLNPSLLPWNTTKTSVDQDSMVWRKLRNEMMIALGQVQSVINKMKVESRAAQDDGDMPITKASRGALSLLLSELDESPTFETPKSSPARRKMNKPREFNIQYKVPLEKFQEIAAVLELTTGSEVGRATFEYVYDNEVDL
ncbi:ATP-binding protein [Rhodococcus qingshengii]|uniref:ATP-binding protein n=1 Tax=Rhodococcus qingshengii TaxID=334542 RepID=UPI0036F21D4B